MDDKVKKGVSTSLILIAIVCLAIGGGGGYFFTNNLYQPKIDTFEDTVVSLGNDVSALNAMISVLEDEKTGYQSQISDLEVELLVLEREIVDKAVTISEYSTEVRNLDYEVRVLEASIRNYKFDVQELEYQIETIMNIRTTQYYAWDYKGKEWTWTIHIPMPLYMEYYSRDRTPSEEWIDMADDPLDDYYIDELVDKMNLAAMARRYNDIEMVEFVIAFVQALPNTSDSATTGSDEYPRYPIETLFDRGGDCEDTSILTIALLDELGYDVALILYDNHAAVGVVVDTYGRYYTSNGKEYFYVETTGEGWDIGEMPTNYIGTSAYVYPLN